MKHIHRLIAIPFFKEQMMLMSMLLIFPAYSFAQNDIAGEILWEDGQPFLLPATLHVKLVKKDGQLLTAYSIPVENGIIDDGDLFHFVNPLLGDMEFHFSVEATMDARTGISVFDILRLRKHIVNIQPFTNALQVFASDVNNSGNISTLDLVQIQKVLLGLSREWSHRENIYFFHKTGLQPPAIGSTLTSVVIYHPDTLPNNLELNFWAVKTGDVVR